MTDEERVNTNKGKGYILVTTLPSGLELYKKKNLAGGWIYYGESCAIFSPIWDNCIGSKEEFIAIAKDSYNLKCE